MFIGDITLYNNPEHNITQALDIDQDNNIYISGKFEGEDTAVLVYGLSDQLIFGQHYLDIAT